MNDQPRRLTPAKAAQLVQKHGCRITVHPDGSFTVDPSQEVEARPLEEVLADKELRKRDPEEYWRQRLAAQTDPETVTYNYFILNPDDGLVKIGYSRQPENRLVLLQYQYQNSNLRLLHQQPGTKSTERDLHDRFAAYREHHEWFRCEGELADFLKGLEPPIQSGD